MGNKERVYKRVLLIQFLIFLCCSDAFAQQGFKLFEVRQEAKMKLPAVELSRHYINMSSTALQRGGLQVGDNIFFQIDGKSQRYRVEKVTSFTDNAYSVMAKSQNGQSGHLSFSVYRDRVMGKIHPTSEKGIYALKYDPFRNSNYITRLNPKEVRKFTCGVNELNMDDIPKTETQQKVSDYTASSTERVQIRLMIVYTAEARQWMEDNGGVDLVLEDAMRRNQESLDNSNVLIDMNLQKSYETEFDESVTGDRRDLLSMLATSPLWAPWGEKYEGYLDDMHQIRYDENIDIVAMIVSNLDVAGSAFLGPDSRYAYSVTRVNYFSSYIMTHEIGHNFGNAHSRKQKNNPAGEAGGRKEYSTGWRWTGEDGNGYVSIMTYSTGVDGEYAPRVAHFSNPDVTHKGTPTGSYTGEYAPADNVRSMNEVRFDVEEFDRKFPTIGFRDNSIDLKADETKKNCSHYCLWRLGDNGREEC